MHGKSSHLRGIGGRGYLEEVLCNCTKVLEEKMSVFLSSLVVKWVCYSPCLLVVQVRAQVMEIYGDYKDHLNDSH